MVPKYIRWRVDNISLNRRWAKEYAPQDWIYQTNLDNSARFVLGINGNNPLVCFGINPSVARPDLPDPTLQRVEKYAYKNGFNSWIMLNIYPQRATNPNEIHSSVDVQLHRENIECIRNVILCQKLMIWAAWGEAINAHNQLLTCLYEIEEVVKEANCRWVALGLTPNNNPYHPLYRGKGFKLYTTQLTPYSRT